MKAVVNEWRQGGMVVDHTGVPHEVKAHIIQTYGSRFHLEVLVETGTCHGAMAKAVAPFFDTVYTIEMHPPNYEAATKNLRSYPNVHTFLGDSAVILGLIVEMLDRPAVFFLDAHYSGGGTARGAVDTPIVRELESLASSEFANVVIIDDARLFQGEEFHTDEFKDYPSQGWISDYVAENFTVPSVVIHEADEFIICPQGDSDA